MSCSCGLKSLVEAVVQHKLLTDESFILLSPQSLLLMKKLKLLPPIPLLVYPMLVPVLHILAFNVCGWKALI